MSDWLDELDGDERAGWDAFVERTRRGTLQQMSESAFVVSVVPKRDDVDIKFAVELGLAIMLSKPILAVVIPGAEVPDKLRVVCEEVVEADLDVWEGRDRVQAAINRMMRA